MVAFAYPVPRVSAITLTSDELDLSWPGTASDHKIRFRPNDTIPPGGRIEIVPQDGQFFVEPFFDHAAVDLAVADTRDGIYIDRDIAATADALNDGVTATASSSSGTISIELNSSTGIDAGKYIEIQLGILADHNASSTSRIVNPSNTGAYKVGIRTYDAAGRMMEKSQAAVFIITPVKTSNYVEKTRSNGTPSGFLNYGTTQAILSLNTNYASICRWSNIASTTYYDMTSTFFFTGGFYHSSIITGIGTGVYNYYVRCRDAFGVADDTDYLISFTIAGFEGEGGDSEENNPGPGGGSGPGTGGGSGGGTGNTSGSASNSTGTNTGVAPGFPYPPEPGDPAVTFSGWAYPDSTVVLLKDGVEDQKVKADFTGLFGINVASLPQGVYTFSLSTEDKAGRKPAAQSFTFYIKEGTKTQLYNVFIPPTVDVTNPSFDAGNAVSVLGQSAANAEIELLFYPKLAKVPEASIKKYNAKSGPGGDWAFNIDTTGLSNGLYQLKARAKFSTSSISAYSKIVDLSAGGELPKQSTCAGADLNGDGKVNITDFSILLYWWGKSNECADQNADGTVNLTDFSIMLYNWTG